MYALFKTGVKRDSESARELADFQIVNASNKKKICSFFVTCLFFGKHPVCTRVLSVLLLLFLLLAFFLAFSSLATGSITVWQSISSRSIDAFRRAKLLCSPVPRQLEAELEKTKKKLSHANVPLALLPTSFRLSFSLRRSCIFQQCARCLVISTLRSSSRGSRSDFIASRLFAFLSFFFFLSLVFCYSSSEHVCISLKRCGDIFANFFPFSLSF